MLLHTSSFWLSGLLWESWGMAERQQTFAWNHRDVCAGLTGTNITITLILEWYPMMSHPVWCTPTLMSFSLFCSCSGWHSPWPCTSKSTGRERSMMPRGNPVLHNKKLSDHLMYYFKPRFMPSQTITSENEAVLFLSLSDLIM